jgi:DNA recombination protein RmuC
LQREFNITVVGPSNLVAFLSSLQMGFRTLAVQKSSNEVWRILGAVKTEFTNFEKVLITAQKQISTASGSLDKLVGVRTRAIQKQLRTVQELPASEAGRLMAATDAESDLQEAEEPDPEEESDVSDTTIT